MIMSKIWKALVSRYHDFFYALFNRTKFRALIPISFDEPWWKLLAYQRVRLFLTLVPLIIARVASMLAPLVLAAIIQRGSPHWLIVFFVVWVVIMAIDYVGDLSFTLLSESTWSVQFYAYQLLVRIDPIFHATRDTGTVVAKIDRAVHSYHKILETGVYELTFTIVSVLTGIFSVWAVDTKIGLVALGLNVVIIVLSIGAYLINNDAFFASWVTADDRFKSVALENISQVGLIRSTFAGNEAMRRLRLNVSKLVSIDRASWGSFLLTNTIMRLLYFAALCVVCAFLIIASTQGHITALTATALVLTYFRGTYDVTKVGRYAYWFVTDIGRIKDLFEFLRGFGRQTFPVLSESEAPSQVPLEREGNITIQARDLEFQYDVNAQIFNGHSLLLTVPMAQKNKLYGIIGPSGIGKTTLLSILGGQLRPTQGTVLLNDIAIYAIDDYARRNLITIQSQTASTLRGSVRYNLLFGLPEQANSSDDELCDILQKVGIWRMFKDKKGLDTIIGEGGLTLSGGQRQRFNFASLYLRARYYKPLLILMDEPTSSLDEISEHAVTGMIDELSSQSIVIVIAHRLQTLDNAVGILDIALIRETKKMRFYAKHELEKHSTYYQKLLEGTIDIAHGA